MNPDSTTRFRLGDRWVDPSASEIDGNHVDARAMEVLVALVDAAPNVLSVAALLERVWPNVVVVDNVVHQAIAQLRRALGGDARSPRYIETIPRRGYRLIAVVEREESTAIAQQRIDSPSGESITPGAVLRRTVYETTGSDPRQQDGAGTSTVERHHTITPRRWRLAWVAGAVVALAIAVSLSVWFATRPAQVAPDLSLAVMPFTVVGGDAEAATYADALTQQLRTDVAGYREVRSVAVEDAANRRGVSDAGYLAGGNVQRVGDGIRVRVSLTRSDDDQIVRAKTFEPPTTDSKTDPVAMAATIGRFIRYQLVWDQACEFVRRTSRSAEAATAYCASIADGDPHLVLSDDQRAIALDPGIVLAYIRVADAYVALGTSGAMDWHDAARHADDALAKGFAIAPNDSRLSGVWQAYVQAALLAQRGRVQGFLELNYPAAEASFKASLEADPLWLAAQFDYQGLGLLAEAQGNLRLALENFRRALRINDSYAAIYVSYAAALWFAGENREAIKVADEGLDLVPSGFYLLALKARAHYALGETAAANAVLDDALASAGPALKLALAAPLAGIGRTEEARQLLARFETIEKPPPISTIDAYAVLDHDRAFKLIHQAIDRHILNVVLLLRVNRILSALRHDPRWAGVMAHLESEEAKGRAQHPS